MVTPLLRVNEQFAVTPTFRCNPRNACNSDLSRNVRSRETTPEVRELCLCVADLNSIYPHPPNPQPTYSRSQTPPILIALGAGEECLDVASRSHALSIPPRGERAWCIAYKPLVLRCRNSCITNQIAEF